MGFLRRFFSRLWSPEPLDARPQEHAGETTVPPDHAVTLYTPLPEPNFHETGGGALIVYLSSDEIESELSEAAKSLDQALAGRLSAGEVMPLLVAIEGQRLDELPGRSQSASPLGEPRLHRARA